jgi:hypothetical protein
MLQCQRVYNGVAHTHMHTRRALVPFAPGCVSACLGLCVSAFVERSHRAGAGGVHTHSHFSLSPHPSFSVVRALSLSLSLSLYLPHTHFSLYFSLSLPLPLSLSPGGVHTPSHLELALANFVGWFLNCPGPPRRNEQVEGMMGGGGQEEALDETEDQRRFTARQDEHDRPGEVGAVKGEGVRLEEHV